MNSAEEKKVKKFPVALMAILWTLVCVVMLLVWGFGDDEERMENLKATMEARQRVEKLDREMRALQRKHDNGQDSKIRSHDERLKVLETAVVDLLTANPKKSDSQVVQPEVRQDKSVSDEDFRAMVLKNVKDKDRMAVVRHFRQEDEFKKSLKLSEKRKFDADVKKAYEELLAECKIAKGSLDKWQANALRQSVETGVILEWRMDEYSNRQVAVKPVSDEEREEKLEKFRLLEGQLEEFGVEMEAE